MDRDITITAIVPVYNVEKYLIQCLDSIIEQSVSFDEVILINDGSTDQSRSICEKYILKFNYFKLINQKNRGLSAARNVGLDYVTSEYVLFLDSDDYLRTDTIKRLKDELKYFEADAVYFDANIHCEKGYECSKNNYSRDIEELENIKMSGWSFFLKCYPENYYPSVCLAIYRKKAIQMAAIRFPEGLYFEDEYFTFAFMIKAQNVIYISEKLYQRRYRENSITTSKFSEKKFRDCIQIILLIWEEAVKQQKLVNEESSILPKFISNYCKLALQYHKLCIDQNIAFGDETRNIFHDMIRIYKSLMKQVCLDNDNEDLFLLNLVSKNLREITLYCSQYKIQIEQIITKLAKKQIQLYKRLLSNLPLNIKGCKVGIYGTGKHTDSLLTIYEKLFGEITCNLFFIDSNKKSGKYRNRDIIPYQKVDDSFDLIIISSCQYRHEMIDNIKKLNKKVSIYSFYNDLKEDIFSQLNL